MTIVLFIMSFANFVFYPLVIGFIIALIIEQVLRRGENEGNILIAMTVRKFLWRNAWIANIVWFLGYAILLFMVKPGPQQMPDMIWQGGVT
jgi:TctA family transporter